MPSDWTLPLTQLWRQKDLFVFFHMLLTHNPLSINAGLFEKSIVVHRRMEIKFYLCTTMHFMSQRRYNPKTQCDKWYYRIKESYRDLTGRVRSRWGCLWFWLSDGGACTREQIPSWRTYGCGGYSQRLFAGKWRKKVRKSVTKTVKYDGKWWRKISKTFKN